MWDLPTLHMLNQQYEEVLRERHAASARIFYELERWDDDGGSQAHPDALAIALDTD